MKKGWLVFLVLLAAAALTLSGILLGKFSREEKIFQEQAALNGIVYDEAFLEEAAKLPGIQSVEPVVSLAVELKVGEYSVETELLGVELTNLHYQAEKASDTALGRTPALLIGKEALFGLVDANGQCNLRKAPRPAARRVSGAFDHCLLLEPAGTDLFLPGGSGLKGTSGSSLAFHRPGKNAGRAVWPAFFHQGSSSHGERGDEFPEGKGKLCPDEGRLIKRPWPESREAQIRPQWWPSRRALRCISPEIQFSMRPIQPESVQ